MLKRSEVADLALLTQAYSQRRSAVIQSKFVSDSSEEKPSNKQTMDDPDAIEL